MVEPLYTADEMRAAEAGHDVEELMARAGRAVAEEAMRRFPQARRFVAVCGGGANGGDGRISVDVLGSAGRDAIAADDVSGAEVIIDALFGTGFHGEPREDAARKIEAINASHAPVVAVDLPSGINASTGEVAGACRRRPDRDDARAQGRARGSAWALSRRRGGRRRHRARAPRH
jgi:NAD(P)H-hydrate epimerase